MRGLPEYALPDLQKCMDANVATASVTNPNVKFVGISINTSGMQAEDAMAYMDKVETELGLPVVDPFRQGVARIVDKLMEL